MKSFNDRTQQLEKEQKLVDLAMFLIMVVIVSAIILAPFYV